MAWVDDTFNRANQSGWGSASGADSNLSWSGSSSDWQILSNTGRTQTGFFTGRQVVGDVRTHSAQVYVEVGRISNPGDSAHQVGVILRNSGTTVSNPRYEVLYAPSNQELRIRKYGTTSPFEATLTSTTLSGMGEHIHIFATAETVDGDVLLRAWVWNDGSADPTGGTATLSTTDTGATLGDPHLAGTTGVVGAQRSGSTSHTIIFERFTADEVGGGDLEPGDWTDWVQTTTDADPGTAQVVRTFDGVDDFAEAADSASLRTPTTAITLCGWFRQESATMDWSTLVGKYQSASDPWYGYAIDADDNKNRMFALGGSSTWTSTNTIPPLNGQWRFLAATWSTGNVLRLRAWDLSGSLTSNVTSGTWSTAIAHGSHPFRIARNVASEFWAGAVANVALSSRLWTDGELDAYRADGHIPDDPDLAGLWEMSTSGATISDLSGNGNTLTVTGAGTASRPAEIPLLSPPPITGASDWGTANATLENPGEPPPPGQTGLWMKVGGQRVEVPDLRVKVS